MPLTTLCHRLGMSALIALVALPCASVPARAQYFGQNKVRYESPGFHVLKTEHFDIYYCDEERGVVNEVAIMAERWHARLTRVLRHELSRRQPLILYPSHPAFQQTNAIPSQLSEGVGGVTESFKRRIVLPVTGSRAETDHVIGHELVHAFQYDMGGTARTVGRAGGGIERLPLWFLEGMAEYLSIGAADPHTAMWIRDAAVSDRLPSFGRLSDPRYFPYRYGQAIWSHVVARHGEDVIGRLLKTAATGGDPRGAFRAVLGTGPDSLIAEWHRAVREWNAPIAAATLTPSQQATPLVLEKRGGGRLNLAPALSPDGEKLVFLSERGRYSIEMYLADARTGRIERQITKTAVDPHFQSLGFIASAGAFSPDGKRFAFGAVSRGRPVISILEVASGRVVAEHRFPRLGEIFTPSWAPDGRRIAFSALADGVTDLWVLDLEIGRARRLTEDRHADLQPAWSPDGERIAFVTDRFAEKEGPAEYRLALLDPGSGTIRPVPAFAGAKHINPAWSRDGTSLYFVSDRGGISDLYRVELATGERRQLTRLVTGVSGLTALSPAFSLARAADRLVFSAYEKGSHNLYRLEGEALEGEPLRPPATETAGRLPSPRDGTREAPAAAAAVDTLGFRHAPYRARLSLDNVSQLVLGVAGTSSGVGLSGGAIFYWSDMLGDHTLATALQFLDAGGSVVNNTGFLVGYQNLRSRWNWGLQASQIPTVTSSFIEDVVPVNGRPALRAREDRYWQIDRSLLAGVARPFDRFRRAELNAGVRRISFAHEAYTQIFDSNGLLLDQFTERLPSDSLPALTLGAFGAALVSDNAVFGGTAPMMGQRYRFELVPVVGSLRFTEALGDYRRYLPLARALTLAGRVLHFGRYGSDGEDRRLAPLFVGYPSLVRGYDAGSFSSAECGPTPQDPGGCPAFDRLLGSRLAVANLELRMPLLGAYGLIPSSGVPPIESALFFDAGAAWRQGQSPWLLGGDVRPVTSMGVALRVNLFGFAVGEVDLVHPNHRPGKGWYWQFSLQPGF